MKKTNKERVMGLYKTNFYKKETDHYHEVLFYISFILKDSPMSTFQTKIKIV